MLYMVDIEDNNGYSIFKSLVETDMSQPELEEHIDLISGIKTNNDIYVFYWLHNVDRFRLFHRHNDLISGIKTNNDIYVRKIHSVRELEKNILYWKENVL